MAQAPSFSVPMWPAAEHGAAQDVQPDLGQDGGAGSGTGRNPGQVGGADGGTGRDPGQDGGAGGSAQPGKMLGSPAVFIQTQAAE